nr:hypothetical protein [Kibdelosporangium sp. MJ126-NF4]CTQ96980.1 hypothetical protein [Kibdelosporangium sp. MJ126-NF4]
MQTSLTEQDLQDVRQPVFVDPSGRRRRILRRIALGVCALLLCYGVVVVAALLGAPIPQSVLLPVPGGPPGQAPVPTEWGNQGVPPGTPTSKRNPGPEKTTAPRGNHATTNAPAGTSVVVPTQPVTPAVTPGSTLDRPNSNAASEPPGLARHSESKNRGHGNG